ncbi:MAG: hypothetical protein R3F20_09170 [Planctomycetota bacterium]
MIGTNSLRYLERASVVFMSLVVAWGCSRDASESAKDAKPLVDLGSNLEGSTGCWYRQIDSEKGRTSVAEFQPGVLVISIFASVNDGQPVLRAWGHELATAALVADQGVPAELVVEAASGNSLSLTGVSTKDGALHLGFELIRKLVKFAQDEEETIAYFEGPGIHRAVQNADLTGIDREVAWVNGGE